MSRNSYYVNLLYNLLIYIESFCNAQLWYTTYSGHYLPRDYKIVGVNYSLQILEREIDLDIIVDIYLLRRLISQQPIQLFPRCDLVTRRYACRRRQSTVYVDTIIYCIARRVLYTLPGLRHRFQGVNLRSGQLPGMCFFGIPGLPAGCGEGDFRMSRNNATEGLLTVNIAVFAHISPF